MLKDNFLKTATSCFIFIAIFAYYFYLSYTIPFIFDDNVYIGLKDLPFSQFITQVLSEFNWNVRIGWTVFKFLCYFAIPFYLVIPFLHIANLLLIYYIASNNKLNVLNLSQTKDFLVLFIFYTFLNASPFQGIIWISGTLSNNFGFLFLLLFGLYVKKLVLHTWLNKATHVWGLLSAFLVGWSIESIPIHIMASFVFVIIYLFYQNKNIISYMASQKMLLLAYFTTFIGFLSCAITAGFWQKRMAAVNGTKTWNLLESFIPIPPINQFLFWFLIASIIAYFLFRDKLSDNFKKTKEQSFILIGFLILLNFFTLAINAKTVIGGTVGPNQARTFFYHTFIAGSILFYIYLMLKPYLKPLLKKAIYSCIIFMGCASAFYLYYNVSLERFKYDYIVNILEKNEGKQVVYIPQSKTIPPTLFSKSLYNLANLSKKYTPNHVMYEWFANQFLVVWEKPYIAKKYNIVSIEGVPYNQFILLANKNIVDKTF